MPTYGYTGREPDATGLLHYRARYYHPEIGRFVSRDPLGLSAGINPYAYADGNPVLFNDPDGLMAALAWNSASSYVSQNGTRILDGTQTVLDVAGLVPGFGELADGANALIYLGRGDNTNAALSGAAMIPFIGWGATTAKVVGRVDNAAGVAKEITLSRSLHGEAATHASDAISAGRPTVLTIDRAGAAANRNASMGGIDKVPGKHLDEYPPAMFREGGAGASVRAISPRENMSAGACIGNACRGLPDGTKVRINIGN